MVTYKIGTTHGDFVVKAPNPILAIGAVMNQNPKASIVDLKRQNTTDVLIVDNNFKLKK